MDSCVECPKCEGRGELVFWNTQLRSRECDGLDHESCPLCAGAGVVPCEAEAAQ